MLLLPIVTAPLRASARPISVAPSFNVMVCGSGSTSRCGNSLARVEKLTPRVAGEHRSMERITTYGFGGRIHARRVEGTSYFGKPNRAGTGASFRPRSGYCGLIVFPLPIVTDPSRANALPIRVE